MYDHLKNGTGLTGGVKLNDTTAHDDAAVDVLSGGFGDDWFLANGDMGIKDIITDGTRREQYADLD